ncbi:MAG: hypothetical protein IKT44_04095 [Clostridia bacterium]|nr:hypothetical protein [Clostridia bacterium]
MTFIDILKTLFEIAMVAGLLWCIFHEDRLVAFEEKVMSGIRRKRLREVPQRRHTSFNI